MNQYKISKLAVLDVDGTIIDGQSQKELLKYFRSINRLSLTRYIFIYLWFVLYKINLVEDVDYIFNYAFLSIKNEKVDELDKIFDSFFNLKLKFLIRDSAIKYIEGLKRNGYTLILLSTAIDPIVKRLSKYLDIDKFICTQLSVVGDEYAGDVKGYVVYSQHKKILLNEFIENNCVSNCETLIVADHVSDIPILESTTKGVIVNPSVFLKRKILQHDSKIGIIKL